MPHLALAPLALLPLAHVGHWYHSLIYAVPLLLIVLLVVLGSWRDRRRKRGDGDDEPAAPSEDPEEVA